VKMKPFANSRTHQSEEMALQITSMADIFVIILVFLLKSYATGAVNVSPTAGMTLPLAQAGDQSVEALRVEVTKDVVQLDGQPVVSLKGFSFEASDLQANGVSTQLGKALEQYRNRQLQIAKVNTSVKVDARVLVLSDQKTPYSTLKTVLASAALHGYTDFKLAVVRGD
jgi:biopolymer transport protein ExbD